jgi:hypothetical protein
MVEVRPAEVRAAEVRLAQIRFPRFAPLRSVLGRLTAQRSILTLGCFDRHAFQAFVRFINLARGSASRRPAGRS